MRLFFSSWWLQLRLLSRSPFFMGMALLTPIAYGTITVLMSGSQANLRTVLGAGIMGAWATTLYGAAEALFMQRYTGTLEFLIGAPRALVAPVLGFAAATVSLGVYSIAAVWLWSALLLQVPLGFANAPAVVSALAAAFVALVSVGVLLSGFYVLTRRAMAFTNLMEYPIWIVCGVAAPAVFLWPPLTALGRLLPLGWAMSALDEAANPTWQSSSAWLFSLAAALVLSAVYLAAGIFLLHRVDMLARIRGTLRLR